MQSRTIILLVSRDLSHPDSFPAIPTFLAPVQVCGDETSEDKEEGRKEAGKPGGGRAESGEGLELNKALLSPPPHMRSIVLAILRLL